MQDVMSRLKTLHRPQLLLRAARFGLSDYKRERDLRRLVKAARLPGPRQAVMQLMDEESYLNDLRKTGGGMYNVARHVQVMIALLGEASLIDAAQKEKSHLRSV